MTITGGAIYYTPGYVYSTGSKTITFQNCTSTLFGGTTTQLNPNGIFGSSSKSLSSSGSAQDINIFPNPANSRVTILPTQNAPVQITIFDAQGSMVYQRESQGMTEINTENFATGVYVVHLTSEGVKKVEKLIIAH